MRSGPSLQLKIAGVCFAVGAALMLFTLTRGGRGPAPAPDPTTPARTTAPVEVTPTSAPTAESAATIVLATAEIRAGVPPLNKDDCPPGYPVKGNQQSKRYHERGDQGYAATDPEICFATAADARAAGFSRTGN